MFPNLPHLARYGFTNCQLFLENIWHPIDDTADQLSKEYDPIFGMIQKLAI